MTKPLKEELLAWLEKMKQDEQSAPENISADSPLVFLIRIIRSEEHTSELQSR